MEPRKYPEKFGRIHHQVNRPSRSRLIDTLTVVQIYTRYLFSQKKIVNKNVDVLFVALQQY